MRRHDWVYLREGARPEFATADAGALAYARAWVGQGRPLVAARQNGSRDRLALGLALPLAHAVRRLTCSVDRVQVDRSHGPLTVEEVAHVLSAGDGTTLRRFARSLAGRAAGLGVFGSTAWEAMSGLRHRHEDSDVDVVCDIASNAGLSACLAAIRDSTRETGARLDVEVRFPDGRAVSLRELDAACAGRAHHVLAKGERDAVLLPLHHLLASLR